MGLCKYCDQAGCEEDCRDENEMYDYDDGSLPCGCCSCCGCSCDEYDDDNYDSLEEAERKAMEEW